MIGTARLHRAIPGSLLAVIVATAVAGVAGMTVPKHRDAPQRLPVPAFPSISLARVSDLFSAALAVALLAGLESLLSAKVADGMSDAPPHNPDRELFGQGLANLVVPMFGGMPATGAIARTAVNVRSGGRTRLAAITHALVLIAVVYLGGSLVGRIPLAALAGVLMVTAVRMVDLHGVRMVLRSTRGDAAVLLLTAVATIAFDLIVAVEIGVAVAALLALRAVARNALAVPEGVAASDAVTPDDEDELLSEHILTYRLDGALFFGAAQRFLAEITAVRGVRVVILRLPQLQVLDATGAQALGEIVQQLEARGITVLIKGPRPQHLKVLEAVGVLGHLAHERHLFDNLDTAVEHARTRRTRGDRRGVDGPALLRVAQVCLDSLHLGVERVGDPRPVVELDHRADTRRVLGDLQHARLHERHHLVPLAFDVREHRVGLVGQPTLADEANRLGDRGADGLAGTHGRDGEGSDHAAILARSLRAPHHRCRRAARSPSRVPGCAQPAPTKELRR